MNTDKQSTTSTSTDEHVIPPTAGSACDAAATGGDAGNEVHPPTVVEDLTPPNIGGRSASATAAKGKGKVVQGEGAGDEENETDVNNAAAEMAPEGESEPITLNTVLLSGIPSIMRRKLLKGVPSPCVVCQKAFRSFSALIHHLRTHGEDVFRRITVTYDVRAIAPITELEHNGEAAENKALTGGNEAVARNKTLTSDSEEAVPSKTLTGDKEETVRNEILIGVPAGPSLQRDNMDLDFDLNLPLPEAQED